MKITIRSLIALSAVLSLLVCCQASPERSANVDGNDDEPSGTQLSAPPEAGVEIATLAGGCFWCMQPPYDEVAGVHSVTMGYTGGDTEHPTYEEVAGGRTTHLEAVEIRFDPEVIGFEEILDIFWRNIDPTDEGGQFADRGHHYTTAIFYHDDEQRQIAEDSLADFDTHGPFDEPVVTVIRQAMPFWVAEDYHQDFYKKNPRRYERYYRGSGRPRFFNETWY